MIKDKGVDGFNLLMGALKNCQHDSNQMALGERLYAALQETFSSSDNSSREASPISLHDEWMSAYESATDDPAMLTNMTSAAVTNEMTPLVSSVDTDRSSLATHRKKKVTLLVLMCNLISLNNCVT